MWRTEVDVFVKVADEVGNAVVSLWGERNWEIGIGGGKLGIITRGDKLGEGARSYEWEKLATLILDTLFWHLLYHWFTSLFFFLLKKLVTFIIGIISDNKLIFYLLILMVTRFFNLW